MFTQSLSRPTTILPGEPEEEFSVGGSPALPSQSPLGVFNGTMEEGFVARFGEVRVTLDPAPAYSVMFRGKSHVAVAPLEMDVLDCGHDTQRGTDVTDPSTVQEPVMHQPPGT